MHIIRSFIHIVMSLALLFGGFTASSLEKRDGLVVIHLDFEDETGGEDGVSDNHGTEDGTSDSPSGNGSTGNGGGKGNHGNKSDPASNKGNSSDDENVKFERFVNKSNQVVRAETDRVTGTLSSTFSELEKGLTTSAEVFQNSKLNEINKFETFSALANGESDPDNLYFTEQLTDLVSLEQSTYISEHKAELASVKQQLMSTSSRSPQQSNAKLAGLQSLKISDQAYNKGKNAEGDFYREAAKQLASIVTDFIPVTSVAKDVYGLFVGKDLLTGEKLSTFERSLCGTFAIAAIAGSIYTGGTAAPFILAGIKEIRNLTKAESSVIKITERLTKIAKVIPHRVTVALPGSSKNYTLIGRDMEKVIQMKNALKNEGVVVNVFDDTVYSKDSYNVFLATIKDFAKKGERVPDAVIRDTTIYAENKTWIESAIEKGHTILDTGDILGKETSAFYEMEKTVVEEAKRLGTR